MERLLVPFARETIWYEPALLQRRARAVREQLSPAQLLEAVGVLALANGLCRLRAVLGRPPRRGRGPRRRHAPGAGRALPRAPAHRGPAGADRGGGGDQQRLQEACSRLAPGGVVQRLIADAGAERKVVTALFADLVGYTAMSERLEPSVLARVLNGYFQRMSDAIHEHRGHVATFGGDGILAYFGALQPNPWQCDDAVRAALAMQAQRRGYNADLEAQGLPPLAVGIGIHRGPGLAGLVGSRERREYAFVGRTVNLAARVQALTRTHQVDILVTEALRERLDRRFVLTPMRPESVKDIAEPVVTYAIRS